MSSTSITSIDNLSSLKKTKDINGNNSVASSLNSIVKKQFINMTEHYNLYASAITEMEEKIKALKSIMLSDTFLKNCQNMELSRDAIGPGGLGSIDRKKKKKIFSDSNDGGGGEEPTNKIIFSSHQQPPIENVARDEYFTPKQSDSLFWCFYILYNGYNSYEYETNYFTAEQQFKVQTVEKVKKGDNKQILKDNKISKKCLESGVMGNITPKILHALCLFYDVNVFYVHKNTYYDMTITAEKTTSIIRYNAETHNYSVSMGAGVGVGVGTVAGIPTQSNTSPKVCEYIEKIKESHWKLETLDKPLRAITSYSIAELVNICNKFDISITNESNKKKTKADLYSSILQKL
jgi:hypothetical protein